jgi:hypothetical protein
VSEERFDVGAAVGVVPLEGRGTLPLVDLHGEPMFLHPVRALLRSGAVDRVVVTGDDADTLSRARLQVERHGVAVEVTDGARFWAAVGQSVVVLADPLCPLLPAGFVARLVEEAREDAVARAGYRPVTDTVKTVVDRRITGTLDRDRLVVVASPVVLPASLATQRPPVADFAALAAWLRKRAALVLVRAPSMARRVGDESAVRVLECLDELGRRVQEG